MKIVDPRDSKHYEVKNLREVQHRMPDKQGKTQLVDCVEYTVVGKNHDWEFWMSLEDFRRANPTIRTKEGDDGHRN